MSGKILAVVVLSMGFEAGCRQPAPTLVCAIGSDSETSAGNFILYVANYSIDRPLVDIQISLDGNVIVEGEIRNIAPEELPAKYTFALEPGRHVLTARSDRGDVSFATTFVVTGEHWAGLSYDFASGRKGVKKPPGFWFDMRDEPILFW